MWGSRVSEEVLETLAQLRSQSYQDRLKDVVLAPGSDKSEEWLRGQCQPCPQCLVCCRRETGCDHIVCRCGCDFCFVCGAPSGEDCLCCSLAPECMQGSVFFAAWLRSSWQSPCEWLWEEEEDADRPENESPSALVPTLGFWLWAAGAKIHVVWEGPGSVQYEKNQTTLPPLQWLTSDSYGAYSDSCEDLSDDDCYEPDERQYLSGHLRKEAYSHQSQRALRCRTQRRSSRTSSKVAGEDVCYGRPKANRTLY